MTAITYIYHDCFVVRTSAAILVFDFWKMQASLAAVIPGIAASVTMPAERKALPVYVFVSHFHKDHYNRDIFTWSERVDNIRFIISKDVARHARHILNRESLYKGCRPSPGSVTVLGEGEHYSDACLEVDAFGSTDIGNSYMVRVDGMKIFHAGDLNAWIWKDESTHEEVAQAISDFKSILIDIRKKCRDIDIAFFPVDSRLGTDYYEGARIFLQMFRVNYFFPMHFCIMDDNEAYKALGTRRRMDALKFDDYANPAFPTVFIGLTTAGDKVMLPKASFPLCLY